MVGESHLGPGEKTHPLEMASGWTEVLGNGEDSAFWQYLEELTELTRGKLQQTPAPPEWTVNTKEITYRWQQAIELIERFHVKPEDAEVLPEAVRLELAMSELQSILNSEGWQEEGVVFKLPLITDSYGKPVLLDLRFMGPPHSILPIGLETFKALDDDAVQSIIDECNRRLEECGWDMFDKPRLYPAYRQVWDDRDKLEKLLIWRRYGKPDRELTDDDINQYVAQLVQYRINEEPQYGMLPESFNGLPDDQREAINSLFDYFFSMRDPYEYLVLDTYSLLSTLGLEPDTVSTLVKNGVLRSAGSYIGPDAGQYYQFELAQDYHAHFLRLRYYPQPIDETENS